ncbi:MAG: VC2046/SO_2500 family protein [Colwellia polaris]|uniref:VC2046/SO_2500 family protein n=1 Tax=Colwellia polaris TaxID=326537 RepID=UPI001E352DE0|nr:VC2046/SO_2500 family protein [Colwellia polaris]
MTIENISNDILVHELQLGEQLNESVHSKRRADFSLLLAMLTDDVRAHSQFKLPQTVTPANVTTSELLRKRFQLPKEAPIALKDIEDTQLFNQADLIESKRLEHLRLMNALNPNPLAFRNDTGFINQQVMSNTSLYCQQKYINKALEQSQPHTEFNAEAWLSGIKNTLEKSAAVEAVA